MTSGLFESHWPAKLRVVFPDQNKAVAILVRHYEIKEKCSYIEIRESGDIFCQGTKNEFTIPARNGLVMEFKYKKNGEKYKEVKDSQFLPKSHDISPTTATEFWAREKRVVQNALLCCEVKFIYSEKVTKFCEISTLILSYLMPVKSKVEILQHFVAFSEYMNFKTSCLYVIYGLQ